MFNNISESEICFFLPEDGNIAAKKLLAEFDSLNITEIYIKAYAFNWDALLAKVQKIDDAGVPVYILADYVQSRSLYAWNELVALHKNLKHGSIILTTAGANSTSTGQCWHSKAITFRYKDKSAKNWAGSVNFSESGWKQGNTARLFVSQAWSDNFVEHFKVHQAWALDKAKNKQIDYLLSHPIQAQDLEMTEDTADYIFGIEKLETENKKLKKIAVLLAIWTLGELLFIIIQRFVIGTPIGG